MRLFLRLEDVCNLLYAIDESYSGVLYIEPNNGRVYCSDECSYVGDRMVSRLDRYAKFIEINNQEALDLYDRVCCIPLSDIVLKFKYIIERS